MWVIFHWEERVCILGLLLLALRLLPVRTMGACPRCCIFATMIPTCWCWWCSQVSMPSTRCPAGLQCFKHLPKVFLGCFRCCGLQRSIRRWVKPRAILWRHCKCYMSVGLKWWLRIWGTGCRHNKWVILINRVITGLVRLVKITCRSAIWSSWWGRWASDGCRRWGWNLHVSCSALCAFPCLSHQYSDKLY